MDILFRCSLFVLLAYFFTLVPVTVEGHSGVLRRQKREWILAPRNLTEGQDYTTYNFIAKIRSDKETSQKIIYSLTGSGVDKDPMGRFAVDRDTGFVRVFSILDREEIAQYKLFGRAQYLDGRLAEKDIALVINVVDINDCTPVIKLQQVGQVSEHSKPGTIVMKVIATDDDDIFYGHSLISYSIDARSNSGGMFAINSQTGEVTVVKTSLDRETKDTYKLTIFASDLGGRPGGNTGTGEIEIKLTDINDNIPTLLKETYEGSVEENTVGVEILRIQAADLDLINTENWFAMYEIVSGNEGGYFTITTDKATNEGIIMTTKALDYEEIQTLNLAVKVKNEAEYNFGSSMSITGASQSKSYPIKINVINQKEGARFQPSVKVVTVSGDKTSISLNKTIATYAAIDSDTQKTATNVWYAKWGDKDNWLSIDKKTAEIRLNKYPNRESTSLVNGTYYVNIMAISNETPSKTSTGTIAIQVEDFNEHCPTLTSTTQTMCFGDNVIYVTAEDRDMFPNSAPFDFTLIQSNSKEKWIMEPFNETTVLLRDQGNLWPGTYKVSLNVKDQQGKSCDAPQIMEVMVCTCHDTTKSCLLRRTGKAVFGAGGILLMLLGLLLLLLVPLLLLFCLCGSAARDFKAIPFEAKEHLISYNTEGQGEGKDVPLLHVPVNVDGGTISKKDINISGGRGLDNLIVNSGAAVGGGRVLTAEDMRLHNKYNYSTVQDGFDFRGAGTLRGEDMSISKYRFSAFDGMALPDYYLGQYYSVKSSQGSQQHQEKDAELIYDYEGRGSLAGSVGCCSLLENDNDLAFLNDLGPKFKTLAEICLGTTLESTSVDDEVSDLPYQMASPIRPSTSTHTHVHTHTETIRDRDHLNLNTINISNKAAGSSTIIQKERITETSQGSATLPKVQETVVIPNQTLLIQQPAMYYAATPMYVVETKPQMVLVSGGTQQVVGQVGQAGLSQGLIQVGGLQGSQGVMLVEGQVEINGAPGQVAQGLSQGTVSKSTEVFVVKNGSTGGKHSTHYTQSSGEIPQRSLEAGLEMGGKGVHVMSFSAPGQVAQGLSQGTVSKSTEVFVVKNGSAGGKHSTHYTQSSGEIPQRSLEAGLEMGGKGVHVKSFSAGSHGSAGSKEEFALSTTPRFQGQRVVVEQKKVLVTERNLESST